MPAPTVTWQRNNLTRPDDQGVAWGQFTLGTSVPLLWGVWAEPSDQYSYYSPHYSCTPTNPNGHNSDSVVPAGSYLDYNPTSGVYSLLLGFTCPGNSIRVHFWSAV